MLGYNVVSDHSTGFLETVAIVRFFPARKKKIQIQSRIQSVRIHIYYTLMHSK